MDAVIKQKWVDALRSGKYKQGKGLLVNNGKYCCLGVLCKVIGMKRIPPRTNFPPEQVVEQCELPTNNPQVLAPNYAHNPSRPLTLADLNDGTANSKKELTFSEIADIIEEQL